MFGSALDFARRIAAGNRWLVIALAVLVGLWALELIYQRGLALYRDTATLPPQIDKTKADAVAAAADAQARNYNMQRDFNYCKLPDSAKKKMAERFEIAGRPFSPPKCD